MKAGQEIRKIGVCMLFAASCFIAAFVLIEFHGVYIAVAIAGILLMISAYLMLTVVLAEKIREWSKTEEEESPSSREAEATERFQEQVVTCLANIDRKQQAMLTMIESSLEQHKADYSAIENAIEKLAAEQVAGVKTLVKYNKENARQLALNERQSISEMKKDINENISRNAEELKNAIKESIEKISDRAIALPQLPPQTESIAEAAYAVEEAALTIEEPVPEEAEEVTEEIAAEPMPEAAAEPMPETAAEATEEAAIEQQAESIAEEVEEIVQPEQQVAEEVQAEPVAEAKAEAAAEEAPAFDPNAKLSPEDIAKLFAAAEETQEPVAAEEIVQPEQVAEAVQPELVTEAKAEAAAEEAPAFDPNAKLSPEDIAKLFASMGS